MIGPGRWRTLSPPALLALLLLSGEARAHRLEAEAYARPFGVVRLESWFETGDAPKGAKVEVFRPDGGLLVEGRTDDQGAFTFPCSDEGPLKMVVNAGAGHRAETLLKKEDLARAVADTRALCTWIACVTPTPSPYLAAPLLVEVRVESSPAPPPERRTGTPWLKLLLGVSLLLAVGGAARLLRRARHVH